MWEKISKNSKVFKLICVPETEDLKPYVGMAVIAAILAGIETLVM